MIGRIRLIRLIAGALCALGCFAARAAEQLVILAADRAPVPVFVAAGATSDERAAAAELARVIHAMGAPAPLVATEPAGVVPGIYVGATHAAADVAPPLRVAADWFAPATGEVGPDAIRLTGDHGRLFVEAASPEATQFAVAWLLQQYAGVRWFFPGPDGESIPSRSTWSVPGDLRAMRTPAFVSRDMFLSGSDDEAAWAVRNGLRARVEFSHALNRVFTAADADAHPEWFAEVRGQRLRPRDAADHHWQPNLARPEVAVAAGERARAAFAADPERRSFSLGMNDTVRFDQSPETRALVEPVKWFRGMPDYSPLVFTFMNRAAATLDADPAMNGRHLGCLAYFWCENAPPFPVNPRVIPFVTTDRAQFFDANYRNGEQELLGRWGRSGVRTFGLWDYAYGGGFIVPRVPVNALADGIRAGHCAGARGYFADAGPERGFDAFKLWAIAQWLWEPERPVGDLADEFFAGCYGPAAAPMRRFFERAEQRWMVQGGTPFWLKLYEHEDQALLFPPEDCRELRALLADAEHAVGADRAVTARVARTSRAFALTEAFVAFDAVRRRLASASFETGRDNGLGEFAKVPESTGELSAPELRLARALVALELARVRFIAAVEACASGQKPDVFLRNDPVPRLLAELTWRDATGPNRVLARVGREAALPAEWRALAAALGAGRLGGAKNLARNGAFETAAAQGQQPGFLFPRGGELPAEWEWRAVAAEHQRVALLPADGRRPRRNVRFEGAWDSQLFQWNAATAGRLYVATARVRGAVSVGSDAGLFLTFLDGAGKLVGVHRMQTLPRKTTDQWTNLVLADVAPAGAAWVGVGLAASRQTGADWFEAGGVELREVDQQ